MVELFEIFWSAKIELRVIILAVLIGSCFWYWQENKRKQKERHQERLNLIKLKEKEQFEKRFKFPQHIKDSYGFK